jgi:hypothetical protein
VNTVARQKQRERKARKAAERQEWAKGSDKALMVAARLAGMSPNLIHTYQSLGGRERWNKRRLMEYWIEFMDKEPELASAWPMPVDWLTWVGADAHRRRVEQAKKLWQQ